MINNIMPTPKRTEIAGGRITIPCALGSTVPEWHSYSNTLTKAFAKIFKTPLTHSEGGITLQKVDTLPHGSYSIDTRERIILRASDDEGILYAIATLLQIVSIKDGKIGVSRAIIEDYPDKDFRALMVDLAREWHPADTVLQYIELCFMLKIKYLHLHFIDNERYTLPSKAFPLLNSIDCYTYKEIAAMREHAKAHGIVIIPEFEAPGHAAILTKSYPDVFANETVGEIEEMRTENGEALTDASLICAGNPKTMKGIRTLMEEMCELFPEAPYIHIGGDEANIKAWNSCPQCKEYMKKNGIGDVYELYSEFVGRMAKLTLDMGKTPIVWEGFPKTGVHYIPKETIVIAWETMYHLPEELIAEGFKVINSSWRPMYVVPAPEMDWSVREILDWNVYNWQHWYVKSAAHLNPINVSPTDQVIGAEMCLWESTFEQEITRAIYNLTAMSERTWNVKRLWEYIDFVNRAKSTIRTRISRYIQKT